MMSKHGRSLTITLPAHVAPMDYDLIGGNEQGPLIRGIGGIVYSSILGWMAGGARACKCRMGK